MTNFVSMLKLLLSLFLVLTLVIVTQISIASAEDIITTVTIIDPRGVYAQLNVVPEKRIPNVDNRVFNYNTLSLIRVYIAGSDRTNLANLVFSESINSDDDGNYGILLFTGLSSGFYDISIKGYSHLTKLLSNVDFNNNYLLKIYSRDYNGGRFLPARILETAFL